MLFKKFKSWASSLFLGTALLLAGLPAHAEDNWPNKQITFVIALGPGGSADRTARLVALI